MPLFYAVLTLVTFLVWGFDKYRAKMNQWRVPERALFTLAFGGGAFGALAGMYLFHHKTRKTYFWILIGMACVIHAGIIIWLIRYQGVVN